MDVLKNVLGWAAIAAAAAPIWGALLWELVEGAVRPRLIPQAEINALSAVLLAKYGNGAEEAAFIVEDRAWRYSDSFEQGKWRRVRKELQYRSGSMAQKWAVRPHKA
jgi:hypothetical protein